MGIMPIYKVPVIQYHINSQFLSKGNYFSIRISIRNPTTIKKLEFIANLGIRKNDSLKSITCVLAKGPN